MASIDGGSQAHKSSRQPPLRRGVGPRFSPAFSALRASWFFTNSILPSLALHAGGNLLSGLGLLAGKPMEPALASPQPLIWETGADALFWLSVAALIGIATVAAWAYAGLARIVRNGQALGTRH